MRYAEEQLLQDIFDVGIDSGLADANTRELILETMPVQMVGRFPKKDRPDDQLRSDLHCLWRSWSNEVTGFERGLYEPPLATWLHSAGRFVLRPDHRQRLADLRAGVLGIQDTLKIAQDRLAGLVEEAEARYGALTHAQLLKNPEIAAQRAALVEAKRELRSTRLETGSFIADRFRIEGMVGRGGAAGVWKAFDVDTCRYVALKILDPNWHSDSALRRERFLRGARAMLSLNHRNVMRVFDVLMDSSFGQPFYAMQYHPRGDVARLLLEKRRQPSECLAIVLSAAEGLGAAHKHGLVHRDVKPPNVLLQNNGNGCITDFDLVWWSMSSGGTRSSLGTPDYMAPEMRNASEQCHPSADVYSLAMTCAFVINQGNLPGWMYHGRHQFLQALPASGAVKKVLLDATAIDPTKRPIDADAFIGAMHRAMQDGPPITGAPPVGDVPPTSVTLGHPDKVNHYVTMLADEDVPPETAHGFERHFGDPEKRPIFCRVLEAHYRRIKDHAGLERVLRAKLQDLTQRDEQVETWLQIAQLNIKGGKRALAFACYGEVLRRAPERLDVIEDLEHITTLLTDATGADPSYLRRFVNLLEQHLDRVIDAGVAEVIRQRLVSGYRTLLDACKDDPDRVELLHDLARHYKALKEWPNLRTVWVKLISCTAGSERKVIRTQLAYLLEALSEEEAAINMYGTLLAEDPDHRTSLERLQELGAREDLRSRATTLLKKHYRRVDNWVACLELLKEDVQRAMTPKALCEAQMEIGRIYQSQLQDADQALQHFEGAFMADPSHIGARANYYALAAETGSEERMRSALVKCLESASGGQVRLALLMRLIGMAIDRADKCLYLDLALKERPESRHVLAFLAQSYALLDVQGRQLEALELRYSQLSDATERAQALIVLAELRISQRIPLDQTIDDLCGLWAEGVRPPGMVDAIGRLVRAQGDHLDDWFDGCRRTPEPAAIR